MIYVCHTMRCVLIWSWEQGDDVNIDDLASCFKYFSFPKKWDGLLTCAYFWDDGARISPPTSDLDGPSSSLLPDRGGGIAPVGLTLGPPPTRPAEAARNPAITTVMLVGPSILW